MKRIVLSLGLFTFFTQPISANPVPSGSGLSIIAPTVITIPGNYRLANDIEGTIAIAADNVSLDLENKKIIADFSGIVVSGQAEIIIKNGMIENATTIGLFIDDCINVEITSMDFVGNATGICLLTSTCIRVENCTNRNNSDEGIAVNNSNNCMLVNNNCFNNENGIVLLNSSIDNTLNQNSCNSNVTTGITLNTSNNNTVSKNSCKANSDGGISLIASNNNTISENSCNSNGDEGIILVSSDNNIISENCCNSNSIDGISINVSSNDNYVEANITNFNDAEGIGNSGTLNSFFLNKSQQNSGASFSGVPTSMIVTFGLSVGDFIDTTTNLRTGLNIAVIS